MVPVNHLPFTHHGGSIDKTPETAVGTVVTIISHNKKFSLRNLNRSVIAHRIGSCTLGT